MNFPKEKRMKMNLTSTSKFVSLILRHKPETIGIQLDEHGWANVDELIAGISKTRKFNREILEEIVRTDNKQRFTFNEDKTGYMCIYHQTQLQLRKSVHVTENQCFIS